MNEEGGDNCLSATGTTAKWVAGFFFMLVIIVVTLRRNRGPVIITFFHICAGKTGQQQDVKGKYEQKEFHGANVKDFLSQQFCNLQTAGICVVYGATNLFKKVQSAYSFLLFLDDIAFYAVCKREFLSFRHRRKTNSTKYALGAAINPPQVKS